MLAVAAFQTPVHTVGLCGACRYFSQDRCCNSSARLDGHAERGDECPHFRFGAQAPAAQWQIR